MTETTEQTEMADYPYSTSGEPMSDAGHAAVWIAVIVMVVFIGWIFHKARNGE